MAREQPTSIRFSSPTIKAAIDAFSRTEKRSTSNAIETLLEEALKRRHYLTPSGKLGKAATRVDSDE